MKSLGVNFLTPERVAECITKSDNESHFNDGIRKSNYL